MSQIGFQKKSIGGGGVDRWDELYLIFFLMCGFFSPI